MELCNRYCCLGRQVVRAGAGRAFALAQRVPGGCGVRRHGSPSLRRESTGAGQVALIGRTVRSGRAPIAHSGSDHRQAAVVAVFDDRLAPVPARGHVIKHAFEFQSQRTGHPGRLRPI
jgi:hypothetical protein